MGAAKRVEGNVDVMSIQDEPSVGAEIVYPFSKASGIPQPAPIEKAAGILKGAAYIAETEYPVSPNNLHSAQVLRGVLETAKPFSSGMKGSLSQLEQQVLKNEMRGIEKIIDLKCRKSAMRLIQQLKETGRGVLERQAKSPEAKHTAVGLGVDYIEGSLGVDFETTLQGKAWSKIKNDPNYTVAYGKKSLRRDTGLDLTDGGVLSPASI